MRKNNFFRNGLLASVVLFLSLGININAQKKDSCGYAFDARNGTITVPYTKTGVTIEFFYSPNGNFANNGSDWMSEINYRSWEDLQNDFQPKAKPGSKESITIDLNLVKLGRKPTWRAAIKKLELDSVNKEVIRVQTFCNYKSAPDAYLNSMQFYVRDKLVMKK